jgi:hypothetical protein
MLSFKLRNMFSMYGALTGNICNNQDFYVLVWSDLSSQVKLQEMMQE